MFNLLRRYSIKKDVFIYLVGSVAQSASGFILLPIISAHLSNVEFGVYSLILVVSNISSAITYLGVSSGLPRVYLETENSVERKKIFSAGLLLILMGFSLQVIISIFFGEYLSLYLFNNINYGASLSIALVGGALGFLNYYFNTYFRVVNKPIKSFAYNIVSLALTIFSTFGFLHFMSNGVLAVFVSILISQLFVVVVFLFAELNNAASLKVNFTASKKLLSIGIPIVIASLGQMIMDWSDRFLLNNYTSIDQVGTYSAMNRLATIINIALIIPFCQVWVTKMMNVKGKPNSETYFEEALEGVLYFGYIVILVASIFSGDIINFFIKNEHSGVDVFVFVSAMLANLIVGLIMILNGGLVYEYKMHILIYVYWFFGIVKYVMNLMAIPKYGTFGAAVVGLICSLFITMAIGFVSFKFFKFKINWMRILKYSGISAVLGGVGVILMPSTLVYKLIYTIFSLVIMTRMLIKDINIIELFKE